MENGRPSNEVEEVAHMLSAREAADKLGLTHHEVIRRIRRGDIKAEKVGWNYVLREEWVKEARESDWYKRRIARQSA